MRPQRLGVKHQLAAHGSRPKTRLVSFRFCWATGWCRACVYTVGSLPRLPVCQAVLTSSLLDAAHSQALSAGTDSISGAAAVESARDHIGDMSLPGVCDAADLPSPTKDSKVRLRTHTHRT